MKAPFLILLFVITGGSASSRTSDTARLPLPEISYRSLDSLIRTNDYTAVYFWPSWCSACAPKMPPMLNVMRQKKSITFISVNDPQSRPVVPKILLQYPDVVKGYYRIQLHGRQKLIAINDKSQQRYFNWYFTKTTAKDQIEVLRRFLLFDRSGKLLYYSKADFIELPADSLIAALKPYQ